MWLSVRSMIAEKIKARRVDCMRLFVKHKNLLGGFYVADFFPWMGWLNKFNGFETRLEKNFRELDESYEEVIAEHLDPRRPEPKRFFPSAFLNHCNRSTYSSAFRYCWYRLTYYGMSKPVLSKLLL